MANKAIHRDGSLKQTNKSHKTGRHRSKGTIDAIQKGKVKKVTVSRKNHTLTRVERKNQAQQLRKNIRELVDSKKSKLGTLKGAPFLVAVIPLNLDIDARSVVSGLCSCDEENVVTFSKSGITHISSKRFKQRFSFVCPPVGHGLEFGVLDTLKVVDTVLFVTSTENILSIDDWGEGILSVAKAQGIPTSIVCCWNINSLKAKEKSELRQQINYVLNNYMPNEKVIDCGSMSDNLNILRRIGTQKQKSILFRDSRPHIHAESLDFNLDCNKMGTLKFTGFLRGAQLNVNNLIHIPGLGDFQMKLIESTADPHYFEKFVMNSDRPMPERIVLSVANPHLQQTLEVQNIPNPMDAEQTWPTDTEINEAEQTMKTKRLVKTVPKGMSEYQASWIPDIDEINVSDEDEDGDMSIDDTFPQDKKEESDYESDGDMPVDDTSQQDEKEESDYESEDEIEVYVDKYDANFNAQEEKQDLLKLRAAKEDRQFPDELDTPMDMPARTRFSKYRGLESFKTSPWDPKENLPLDYARIFQFQNYERMCKKILKLQDNEVCPVQPGMYITIHIANVPEYMAKKILNYGIPVVAIGMLPHEQKISVMNVKLKQILDFNEPIKSKERLLIQCGYRKFFVNPIFSEHTNASKHKFQRFFQPEGMTIATFYAPIQYRPAPVLCYKIMSNFSLKLVATGSLISCDPDRLILKRIVLSGHPFKVNKRSAVIRFMFFNREDILYFKPCKLLTRAGKLGHIKEPLGTHGHMKCIFDHQIQSHDTIFLHLYKRVFPKWNFEHCTINHFNNDVPDELMQE
uniref:Pre-rRNA-processing protein TSR1 homolog n=1 Tax=Xenopsylla cheopis TaxID=163159 RepID=A0A6M2DCU8_XENCH